MSTKQTQAVDQQTVTELLDNAQLVIPDEQTVLEKLQRANDEHRQLVIKMGFDPTSPDLHLGHAVSMRQLKFFQDLGHLPLIIIGDFTGRIGDPSGRNKSRPPANKEELAANAETYIEQLGKILDISRIEVRRNSEWLEKLTLENLIKLLAQGTLSQVISRDDFRNRLEAGTPVALHEIIYPYLQGMDSVEVKADIEIGGIDQLYAFQAARMLQANLGVEPQASIFMPLLKGLDGTKKMSKSLNNYVGLTDAPNDMFGKIMSIPDTLIEEYLKLASSFSHEQVDTYLKQLSDGKNPMDIKLDLAYNIVAIYHDSIQADGALEYFNKQFRSKDGDHEYVDTTIEATDDLVELLVRIGAGETKTKSRRLIEQGAVEINGIKASLNNVTIDNANNLRIRVGKKRFYRTVVQ